MRLTYKHTLYASYLGYITQAIVNNLSPLLFVTFQREFGISLEQLGLLVSLNFVVQMITDLVAAKFVDKIGYRICIVTAHVLCTIGMVGMGLFPYLFSNAYAGLIAVVIINGIGGGLIEVLISPIVESLPNDQKASAMSLLHSFYCWGHVAVVLLSTLYFTLASTANWRWLPMSWAAIPLLNFFFFTKVPLCKLVEEEARTPVRKLFTQRVFWLFFILMICSGASEQAMSQWASLFAELGLGVSKTLGDLLGPCAFAVLMGLSRTFYGKFGEKIDLRKFLSLSSLLCIGGYLLSVFSPVAILSLVGCGLCGLAVGIMWPGTFSLTSAYYPTGGTAMFAILALAGDVGCSAGPSLVGWISSFAESSGVSFLGAVGTESGLKTGLLFAIIFPLALFICVRLLGKAPKQGETE